MDSLLSDVQSWGLSRVIALVREEQELAISEVTCDQMPLSLVKFCWSWVAAVLYPGACISC